MPIMELKIGLGLKRFLWGVLAVGLVYLLLEYGLDAEVSRIINTALDFVTPGLEP